MVVSWSLDAPPIGETLPTCLAFPEPHSSAKIWPDTVFYESSAEKITSFMKIKHKTFKIWAKQSVERWPSWELAVEAGRILFTSLTLIFQVGFFLSSSNFKGTKIPTEYKKYPHSQFLSSGVLLPQWFFNLKGLVDLLRHFSLLLALPFFKLELLSFQDTLIPGMS